MQLLELLSSPNENRYAFCSVVGTGAHKWIPATPPGSSQHVLNLKCMLQSHQLAIKGYMHPRDLTKNKKIPRTCYKWFFNPEGRRVCITLCPSLTQCICQAAAGKPEHLSPSAPRQLPKQWRSKESERAPSWADLWNRGPSTCGEKGSAQPLNSSSLDLSGCSLQETIPTACIVAAQGRIYKLSVF